MREWQGTDREKTSPVCVRLERAGEAGSTLGFDHAGVFAEFKTNLRRERLLESTAAAKVRGVYKGRRPSIDATEVKRLRDEDGLGPTAIARHLGIGRASGCRVLTGR